MPNGRFWNRYSGRGGDRTGVVGHGRKLARYGTEFSEYCALEHLGTICHLAIRPIRLAMVASNSGGATGC